MEIIKTNITPASEYLDNSIEGLGCQIPDCIDRIKDITDGSPEAIKMFLESLSFDEYSEFLNDLNGYFRNKNKDNCYMDGDGLTADGYMPPESEDRIWLMKESFDLAISQESLEKCAYILGMSILTIHPYLDGNGRTSRIMLALLTNGYSGNEDDRRLFSLIGNRDDEDSYHKSNRSVVDADPRGIMFNNGDYSLCDFVLYNMKTKSISNRFGDNADLSNIPIRVGISNRDKSHYLQD